MTYASDISPELRGRYRVIGATSLRVITKWGELDFATMSAARADQLIAQGCPFLERIKDEPQPEPVMEDSTLDTSNMTAQEIADLIETAPTLAAAEAIALSNPDKAKTKTVQKALEARIGEE